MAGQQADNRINSDILFDLSPEDNQTLRESDLLQLVNYGQLSKSYDFPGVDGKVYTVWFSVLWEDDYLDILQRTTKYAADPILRSRVMQRLKVFKSIQRINTTDFSNSDDMKAKRLLWTAICKMSDVMVQALAARYGEMEAENQIMVMEAITTLSEKLESTKPDMLKKMSLKNKVEEPIINKETNEVVMESEARFAPFSAGNEHVELAAQMQARQKNDVKETVDAVKTQVILDESSPIVASPKK